MSEIEEKKEYLRSYEKAVCQMERSKAGRYYAYMGKDHAVEIFKKYVAIV